MSSDNEQAKTAAGGASAIWGLVLDHFVDKHAQCVVVTSKELYLQVLLNADDYYTNAGYQERMSQSFGPIFLGMDWGPEYEKESTPTNAAIGKVTRREAFEIT